MGQGNRETVLAAVKDFNVEFYEIDKNPSGEAVQPIYDGLKNKPRLYGLYQRIQTAKINLIRKLR